MNAASRARSLSATYFFAGSASSDVTCLHWSGHGHDRAAPHPVRHIEWIGPRAV